jgi:DNA-binding MarR family transcriptional regulator
MVNNHKDEVPMSTLVAGLGREMTARVRRAMRPLGLGAQQFLVLKQLETLGETSQGELADALAIDRSNLAAIVAELCDRGFAARKRDEIDRRRYVLRLSGRGEKLLQRTEGAIAAAEEDLLGPLDAQEREQLHALLRRVADGVELCPTGAECG